MLLSRRIRNRTLRATWEVRPAASAQVQSTRIDAFPCVFWALGG